MRLHRLLIAVDASDQYSYQSLWEMHLPAFLGIRCSAYYSARNWSKGIVNKEHSYWVQGKFHLQVLLGRRDLQASCVTWSERIFALQRVPPRLAVQA